MVSLPDVGQMLVPVFLDIAAVVSIDNKFIVSGESVAVYDTKIIEEGRV